MGGTGRGHGGGRGGHSAHGGSGAQLRGASRRGVFPPHPRPPPPPPPASPRSLPASSPALTRQPYPARPPPGAFPFTRLLGTGNTKPHPPPPPTGGRRRRLLWPVDVRGDAGGPFGHSGLLAAPARPHQTLRLRCAAQGERLEIEHEGGEEGRQQIMGLGRVKGGGGRGRGAVRSRLPLSDWTVSVSVLLHLLHADPTPPFF